LLYIAWLLDVAWLLGSKHTRVKLNNNF
jgi:hypothetical protein